MHTLRPADQPAAPFSAVIKTGRILESTNAGWFLDSLSKNLAF